MDSIESFIALAIGLFGLIISIVLAVNIIKTGKYSEMTYNLLKKEFENKNKPKIDNTGKKSGNSKIHDVWDQIQKDKTQ